MPFKIAVVMAVYNKKNYVSEAIDSVINQSIGFKKNIQLILVNDKSTDGTLDILEKYHEKYPDNITLITNEKNMGSSYSRNRGLEHVDAKYVNFCDSDDVMSKDAFKVAYDFLEKYWEVNIASIPIYFFVLLFGTLLSVSVSSAFSSCLPILLSNKPMPIIPTIAPTIHCQLFIAHL